MEALETRRLKETLKSLLKKHGLKYQDLAERLDISVPTVNRMLNEGELSLEKLEKACQCLGISVADLVEIVKREKKGFDYYTEAQEAFLAEHPHHFRIFCSLRDGETPEEVRKQFGLSEKSMQKYLVDLDKIKCLELHPNGKLRIIAQLVFMRTGGVLEKIYAKKIGTLASELISNYYGGNPRQGELNHTFSARFQRATYDEFVKEADALFKKYHNISTLEKKMYGKSLLSPCYGFVHLVPGSDFNNQKYGIPKDLD